ncbi:aminoacyl-histidine dipeptidase [Anaerotalea alkaliphila]|uniref:Cytosol non-specific dipeptidase n=1 Tax=Anaerotalea alkaliphila TaxID=2662126 RepID=A0A7X5HXV4_9FIRM|nr:aminoacyl-histidine dipeptidase [Anaerotalea alkaliphila]NDL68625.1 aminoacyl-histidine dipeptidase [Anaerotalea alkaliphila]
MLYESLQPETVFRYFKEINNIPRASGQEKALSDWIVSFARERGLEVHQDSRYNVLVRKPASPGLEGMPGVVLQGHLDMVCEKNKGTVHDFSKDPIRMEVDGGFLRAKGTTLGADNGIAVAMGLAVLDDRDLVHPPLEVLLTTDEEVGMTGALEFDLNLLEGKYLLNLDSEEEGELVVGCAGGLKALLELPVSRTPVPTDAGILLEVSITGLQGGHSGMEIHKNRGNAARLTGTILCKLRDSLDFQLVALQGGEKDNVIPREAFLQVFLTPSQRERFEEAMTAASAEIREETRLTEPGLAIRWNVLEPSAPALEVLDGASLETVLFLLACLPNGVQSMSPELEGFVESSLNLGKVALEQDRMLFLFAIRSSVRTKKYWIARQLQLFADQVDAKLERTADYPQWPVRMEGVLLAKAVAVHEELYGKKPLVKTLHAGVEPGVILEGRPDMEAISLGPDMSGVHSPEERLDIASTARTWDYLLALLAKLGA